MGKFTDFFPQSGKVSQRAGITARFQGLVISRHEKSISDSR
ncbi:hypothetical protein RN333_01210 [Enterobacter kobei]|nr:hypothetical protein [Enterobacter kobei]WNP36867.1 hypothetical protein RN333_01210 [Enterobacter kobei]